MYRIRDSGKRLELVHKTPVGGVPGALAPFRGRLLAGVGATLRIYEAGKKKLLRKCEHRKLPTHIATLHTLGDRIYVGDLQARPGLTLPQLVCNQLSCTCFAEAALAASTSELGGGALPCKPSVCSHTSRQCMLLAFLGCTGSAEASRSHV